MAVIGTHCILELYDCDRLLLNNREALALALKGAASAAGATLLSHTIQGFDPQGFTAMALLSESHIAIHTWPELGYAAADVFTCGPTCNPHHATDHLIKALRAQRHTLRTLKRGVESGDTRPPPSACN